MRSIEISRFEAEYLVDLIEKDDIPLYQELARELRKQWGMGPRVSEAVCAEPVAEAPEPDEPKS